MKKTYEKPSLTFAAVENRENIANTCWGYHGTDTKLYYDLPGKGYASFQIGGGRCHLTLVNVEYYGVEDTAKAYAQLEAGLKAAGGESGNPFKGEGTVVFTSPANMS